MNLSGPVNASHGGIYSLNISLAEQLSGNINTSGGRCASLTPDPQVIGVGVFLCLFILVAIVGNILVILSVLCNRHLQTVTNFFIVNLAIADLLLSIIVLPFSASLEVLGCWVFGRIFCNIWAAVDVLCCTASIMSLCVISIDRYIGVKFCLKYPAIMTERKAAVILVVVWLSSMVISIGPLLGWKEPPPSDESICRITEEPGYALFSSLFSFYLPLLVILVMYFRVYVVARRTTRSLEAGVKRERNKSTEVVLRIHCRSAPEDAGASGKGKGHPFRSSLSVRLMKFSREKKAAKTLAIVVGVFVLCWMPFFFVLPLGTYGAAKAVGSGPLRVRSSRAGSWDPSSGGVESPVRVRELPDRRDSSVKLPPPTPFGCARCVFRADFYAESSCVKAKLHRDRPASVRGTFEYLALTWIVIAEENDNKI
ncbi:hypothetical protein Z043_120997 [Scleropages formosus]|uniref:G-protein coupled receptors family 1 profile domain-containing protein n=1 Tax=Scleropages formosus TaxID=113540 RepID=A0A0P7WCV3_SCLFO|nr:hypothetical protein Z043_120997 [Scleropages formosus]